jgi:small-conductance mechanosensitive channel
LQERRIAFTIGVVYNTPREKLKRIPILIEDIIKPIPDTRFDRAHFKKFGDYSLDFEIVYYVLVPEYATYLDIQQRINLSIYDLFEDEEIEFAYPTQTLVVDKDIKA